MTREELERIYREPQTTLTREKLNEIYNPTEQKTQVLQSVGNKKTLSSHDLIERQKRNARVNQYKADKNARNEANKLKSQQNTNKLLGIETTTVGAEQYNSAPTNFSTTKTLNKINSEVGDKKITDVFSTEYGTQITYEDGTGYWWEPEEKISPEDFKATQESIHNMVKDRQENEFNKKINKWLEPSYKLSKDEEVKAKEYVKQWRKENNAFKNNPYKTQEGIRELQKIAELESKLSGGTAAWAGFTNTIPFLGDIQDKIGNAFGNEAKDVISKDREVLEASKMQNPYATQAGNIAGEIAKYSAGTELLTGAGLLGEGGKITQGVSKIIKNPKLAGSVANILGDTSVDLLVDTIPQLKEDLSTNRENAGVNVLKNVGSNLAMNTLGEGLGIVGGKAFGMAADAYKKKFGKVDSLNPLESTGDVVKEITEENKKGKYSFAQIVNDVSKKSDDQIFDPVEKAFKDPNVGLTHTPEQLNQMKEYYNSADEKVIDFMSKARNGEYVKPLEITTISDSVSNKIKELTGINTIGNKVVLDKQTIAHIDKRHGVKGIADRSMADDNTLARIGYVLENYDDAILGEGSKYVRLSNGEYAPTVVFYKKVDGTYYVVEAVTDAKSKTNRITSVYVSTANPKMAIKKEAYQVPDAIIPRRTSEIEPELTSNYSIPNSTESVNEITDYRKLNIPNHDEMNKLIDKYVGMYGDDIAKIKALDFKKSVNRVIAENSEEAWEELFKNTTELDAMLQGKTYTFKNQRKSKNKSNVQQATYNNELRDIFATETDSIAREAVENSMKKGKVSQTRSNTLENSGINTVDELENKYLNKENFRYQEISEKHSMEEATTRVGLNSEHWKNKLMKQDSLSGTDVDTMMLIYSDLVQKARQSGEDELWKDAGAVFKKIQNAGTKGGQLVQSFAKWSRNTPEGAVAETFRQAKEQTAKVIGDKNAQKLIDDLYEDVQKEVYTLANEAFEKGFDTREGKEAFAKIGQIINANTPKTVGGVVKTYLMDSMLLNFRTLISRNAGGNLGYNAMEFARQPITAAIDKGVSKFTGQRTRTGWSADKISGALEGLAKGISDELSDVRKGVHTAKSGENTIENAIQLNAHALKGKNPVSSAINKIDDLTKHMLSIGDRPFYESAYKQRMAELTDLRRKGLLGEEVSKMSDADFKAFAELSAKMDGLTATYQDQGDMAKAFTDLKHAIGQYSKGAVGFDALSQFAMPFTNTPGNIITRSLEYSPLGAIKNTVNTIGEVRKGEFNQQRFVDELGRNILGTGLFAGGIAAYDNGLMTGSYSDDKDMKNAQKNSGMQEYALRTNLGGKEGNFDISWIPVLGNNMIMAAATKEAFDKGENTADAFGKAASASANALLNTSTLQGLNRVFGGSASYSTENNLFENAKDALTSGFGQAIPSLMRQVAQSTDEYERNLNDGDRPYWQNSMINSIPVLREHLLQPKVDNEGNLIKQNQGRELGSRLLENMISPGKYTEINNSPVNAESMRLFESTGNNYSFLPTASRSDITKDDFEPTDEQYREYQQKLGRHNSELAGALIDSAFYQSLSDEEKEKALQDVYSGMKAVSKMETLSNYSSDDKIAAAYKSGGVQSAIKYMEKKYAFDSLGVNMSGKKAQEAYSKGGLNGLQEYADYSKAVTSLGLSVNNKTQSLYNTGGIPYLQQYSTFKTKADSDRNGSLKKDEVISYLDSTGLSQSEKRYWFSMLSTAKNPY